MLGKAVGFLMLPFYAHALGDTGYGVIGLVDASLNFLTSLLSYGIAGGILRFYHEEALARKGAVVSTAVLLLWLVGTPLVLVLCALGPHLSWVLLSSGDHAFILALALAGFLVDTTSQAAAAYLVIRQRSVLFSVLNLVKLGVGLTLNILFIVVWNWGLLGFFTSSLVSACVAGAFFHWTALHNCGLRFDRAIARRIILFELPMVPGHMVSFASRQAERLLLRFLIGIKSVGILEMAYKFPTLIPMLITEPFFRSWQTKRTETAEEPDAPAVMGRVFVQYSFILLGATTLLAATVKEVIVLLTPPEFWAAGSIARIEILTNLVLGIYYYVFFGLFYTKRTGTISFIRSCTAIGKIPLSVLLIWCWGLRGAAYSALAAAVLQTLWAGLLSQRAYPIVFEWRKLCLMAALAGGTFVLAEWGAQAGGPVDLIARHWVEPSLSKVGALLGNTGLANGRIAEKIAAKVGERLDVLALLLAKGSVCTAFLAIYPLLRASALKTDGHVRC